MWQKVMSELLIRQDIILIFKAMLDPPFLSCHFLAFDASTRVVRKCSQDFEQVKFQRCQRFNKCFEHVSVVIDQIYKRLCRNSSAQVLPLTIPLPDSSVALHVHAD